MAVPDPDALPPKHIGIDWAVVREAVTEAVSEAVGRLVSTLARAGGAD